MPTPSSELFTTLGDPTRRAPGPAGVCSGGGAEPSVQRLLHRGPDRLTPEIEDRLGLAGVDDDPRHPGTTGPGQDG